MAAKQNQQQIQTQLRAFSAATYEHHGSYAYVAGFYETLVSELLAELPAHRQQCHLQSIAQKKATLY